MPPPTSRQNVVWEGSFIVDGVTQQAQIIETNGVHELQVRGGHQSPRGPGAKEEFAHSQTIHVIPYNEMTPRITDTTLLRRLQDEGIISGYTRAANK